MTREEERVDGLLKSYGAHERQLGEHDAQIEAMEKSMERAAAEFSRILVSVKDSCDNSASRLEKAIKEQGLHFEEKFADQQRRRDAAKWSRGQWIAVFTAVFGPMSGIVALLLGVGSG